MGLADLVRDTLNNFLNPSGETAIEQVKQSYGTAALNAENDPDAPKDGLTQRDFEMGDPGTETFSRLYSAIPMRDEPIEISTLSEMRYGNGTCQAMLRVLQLPILATKYGFTPGKNDKDGVVMNFVRDALTLGDWDGGMETPLMQVIYELTQSFWAGFSANEIVWMQRNGKIVIRKIAARAPGSMYPVVDLHGNLVGAYQESLFMGNNRMVFIPREKLLWYAHRMECNNWYGVSDFKPAYPHYENLRKLYIIDNKAHEVGAIPVRVIQPTIGGVTELVKKAAMRVVKRIGLDTAVWLPKDVTLTPFEPSSGTAGATRKDSIDHHTSQMAMSILAHFLQLGVNGQGTYNLSQDQSDFFLMMEQAEMRSLEAAIMSQVIAPMVRLNFGDAPGLCPTFRFADMTDHVRKSIESIFLAIAQQGNRLSDEFIEALGSRVAEDLGLDLGLLESRDSTVPKATVDQATLDEQAMRKFEQQAKMSGPAKAGPGKGNTEGGMNQKVAEQTKKANMSAAELAEIAGKSHNPRDLFAQVKLRLSNRCGILAPVTPADTLSIIDVLNLSDPESLVSVYGLALALVEDAAYNEATE